MIIQHEAANNGEPTWPTRRVLREQKLGERHYCRVQLGLERVLTLDCGHQIMAGTEFNAKECSCYFCWKEGRK